jgi:hypothetical protein
MTNVMFGVIYVNLNAYAGVCLQDFIEESRVREHEKKVQIKLPVFCG